MKGEAARNHYWNLTHELPAEVMGQIEELICFIGRSLKYGALDMGPITKEKILAKIRELYGDKAAEVAERLPLLTLH